MRYFRILCWLSLFMAPVLAVRPALAQDDAAFETGTKPFGSYNGGSIDTVNLLNGNLNVDIPLISYPQKGGKLKLGFALHYQSGGAFVNGGYIGTPDGPEWVYTAGNLEFDHGFNIIQTGAAYVKTDAIGVTDASLETNNVVMSDGSMHSLEPTSTSFGGVWRSTDATGFKAVFGSTWYDLISLKNSEGTQYLPGGVIPGPSRYSDFNYGMILPRASGLIDTNGNQITTSSSGWTDTMGRSIPVPVATTDFSNCSGPLPIYQAWIWNLPGPNGGTYPIKFCSVLILESPSQLPPMYDPNSGYSDYYAGYYNAVALQSVVLPNNKTWTFEYLQDYSGDLQKITFPTGGTLSYTWTPAGNGLAAYENSTAITQIDAVASRTLNSSDGTSPAGTWNYSYQLTTQNYHLTVTTKVTDPLSNDTVHTFTELNSSNTGNSTLYETQTQFYKGSSAGGTLLKTVNTNFSFTMPSTWAVVPYSMFNVVPNQITTTWANGQVRKTTYTYDSGFTFYEPLYVSWPTYATSYPSSPVMTGIYGKVLTTSEYDYGNGAPGPLLRTTTNAYLFQFYLYSSYLSANLLDLPFSIQVANGSGAQQAFTSYGYDESPSPSCACGNQTSTHRWLNTTGAYVTSTSVYDSAGRVTTTYDPKSNPTSFGYSPATCPQSGGGTYAGSGPTCVTNALSQTTFYAYDFNTGLQTSVTDPNSQTTTATYDNMLRTTAVSHPDGGLDTYSYTDTTPNPYVIFTKKITSSLNSVQQGTVDGLGRLIQSKTTVPTSTCSGGYVYQDTKYDALGRGASVSNPDCTASTSDDVVATTLYDALGRTCLVVPQDSTPPSSCPTSAPANDVFTSYSGNATTVTDQAGKTRKSATDGLGRLTDVWEDPNSLNYHTVYTYDALGDLLSVVQGGSHSRTFVYDSLKRLLQSTNPEAGAVCYGTLSGSTCQNNGYDADGNVIYKSDARGLTITYAYDALNRMTGRTYSNGDPSVSYTYDGSTCVGTSPCYNVGRRTSMTDAGGSEIVSYDKMGREWGEQRTTNGVTKSTSYTYNLDGSLATLVYPSGRTITYTPDAAGRPLSAVDTGNSINYATGAVYAPAGALTQIQYGTNLVTTLLYNSRLQPCWLYATTGTALATSTACTGTATAGNILDLKYNFNLGSSDNGNVMGIANNRDTTRSQAFTYDSLNRIVTGAASTYAASPAHCWGEQYSYDQWTNLYAVGAISSAYNGCSQDSLSQTTSANNRLSGLTYDASGNVLTDGVNTYAWNAESEMKTGAGVNYIYDGDGNRVQKSNGKIYWYGAGTEILDESDASGNITNEYVFFGGKRIAMNLVASGNITSTYYYAEDFLGSSRTMVQAGATSPCFDADFLPFGREIDITTTCSTNYKFEGKERDTETGNDDFGARYYSSNLGRWESPDWSSIPAPVPYANLTNPQTLNLYAMVGDNPESFADLDGHQNAANASNCSEDCLVHLFIRVFDQIVHHTAAPDTTKQQEQVSQQAAQNQSHEDHFNNQKTPVLTGECMKNACHSLSLTKGGYSRTQIDFSATIGNVNVSTNKAVSAQADVPSLGISVDFTIDPSMGRDTNVASGGAGVGKHLGVDVNVGQTPNGTLEPNGGTIHLGLSTPTSPVHGSVNLNQGRVNPEFKWVLRGSSPTRSVLQ